MLQHLGSKDNKTAVIKTPVEDVVFNRGNLQHLLYENNTERISDLNKVIRTLREPNIVINGNRNNNKYNYYIKAFEGSKNVKAHLQVVKKAADGNFYVTNFPARSAKINNLIKTGSVIYNDTSRLDSTHIDNNMPVNNIVTDNAQNVNALANKASGSEIPNNSQAEPKPARHKAINPEAVSSDINYVPKGRKRVTIRVAVQKADGSIGFEEVTGKRVNIDGIETVVHKPLPGPTGSYGGGYKITEFKTGREITWIDDLSELDGISFKYILERLKQEVAKLPVLNAEETAPKKKTRSVQSAEQNDNVVDLTNDTEEYKNDNPQGADTQTVTSNKHPEDTNKENSTEAITREKAVDFLADRMLENNSYKNKDMAKKNANLFVTALEKLSETTGIPIEELIREEAPEIRNNSDIEGTAETRNIDNRLRELEQEFDNMSNEDYDAEKFDALEKEYNELTELKNQGREYYQSAYHGTPHRFDEFSAEHIGAGEGVQAHGWGLYFAKDRDVSEAYRRNLTGINETAEYDYDGKPIKQTEFGDISEDTLSFVCSMGKEKTIDGLEEEIEYSKKWLEANKNIQRKEVLDGNIKHLNKLKKDLELVKRLNPEKLIMKNGQLFEVDIPENDVLLDEDKLLGDMVLKNGLVDKLLDWAGENGLYYSINLSSSGGEIYDAIANKLGSDKAASEKLNELGFEGITYDGAQDGRCYVIFDDKAVEVLEKYYQSTGQNNNVVDWTDKFDKVPTFEEIEKHIKDIIESGQVFDTLSPEWKIDIKGGNRVVDKITNQGNFQKLKMSPKKRHNKYVKGIEELINNSLYSHSDKNQKIKEKPNVLNYHYFDVNVKIGDKSHWVRLECEENKNASKGNYAKRSKNSSRGDNNIEQTNNNVKTVHLYNIKEMKANKILNRDEDYQGNLFFDNLKARDLRKVKGSYIPAENLIELFKNADESTIVHEFGHWWLERLVKYSANNEELASDIEAVRNFVKNDGGEFTREQHEKFARGFEAYIRNGHAENNRLKRIFEDFKNALIAIYDNIKQLGFKDSDMPGIQKLFDRLFTSGKERSKAAFMEKADKIDAEYKDIDLTPVYEKISKGIKGKDLAKILPEEIRDIIKGDADNYTFDEMTTGETNKKGAHIGKKAVISLNLDAIGNSPYKFIETLTHEIKHANQRKTYLQIMAKPKNTWTPAERTFIAHYNICKKVNTERQKYYNKHKNLIDKFRKGNFYTEEERTNAISELNAEEQKIIDDYDGKFEDYWNSQLEAEARTEGVKNAKGYRKKSGYTLSRPSKTKRTDSGFTKKRNLGPDTRHSTGEYSESEGEYKQRGIEEEALDKVYDWHGNIGKDRFDVDKTLNSFVQMTKGIGKEYSKKLGMKVTDKMVREIMPFLRERTGFPEKLDRPDLRKFFDRLSGTEKVRLTKLADEVSNKFDKYYKNYEAANGVIDAEGIENHISHIWDLDNKQKSMMTNYFTTSSKFAKNRTIDTLIKGIDGFEADGKLIQFKPKTLDYAEILKSSSDNLIKATHGKILADELKNLKYNGKPLIMESSKAPSGWVEISHPALNKSVYAGTTKDNNLILKKGTVKVHPAIAPQLSAIFEVQKQDSAVQAMSLWQKTTPEGAVKQAQKIIDEYNQTARKKIPDLTEKQAKTIIETAENIQKLPEGREKEVATGLLLKQFADLVPKSFGNKLKTIRNISLLLNPTTIDRNRSVTVVSKFLRKELSLPCFVILQQILSFVYLFHTCRNRNIVNSYRH